MLNVGKAKKIMAERGKRVTGQKGSNARKIAADKLRRRRLRNAKNKLSKPRSKRITKI